MKIKKPVLLLLFAVAVGLGLFYVDSEPSRAQAAPSQGLLNPRLVVSCFLDDSMSVIDARTVRMLGKFSVGSNPERMSVSPDNKYIAVTQPAHADPQMTTPVDVCFSTDGARLYVLDSKTCTLLELHVPSFEVVRTLPLNGLGPSLMRISKNGAKMFISHEDTGLLTVVDLFNWSIYKQMGVGPKAGGLDLSSDNGRLVVALPSESMVGIYKTPNLELLKKVPVGSGAGIVGVSPKDQVVVLNTISNDVSMFPLDRPSARFRTAVGVGPRDLCFAPDGSMCYVANFNTDDISVIDMAKGTQLGRLLVGKGPRAVVWLF